jgi:hypothetical protein
MNKRSEDNMGNERQRLRLVKALVEGGHYNRREAIEATAAAVVKSKALHQLLDNYVIYAVDGDKEMAEPKDEKYSDIKRKIDEGFYDDPNCLADLAEKIIRKMGLEQDE